MVLTTNPEVIQIYRDRAPGESFRALYGTTDAEKIVETLIGVAAKNAVILGAVTAAAGSIDEIIAIANFVGGNGLGFSTRIARAAAALSAEAILPVRFQ